MSEQPISEQEVEKLIEGLDDIERIVKEVAISWDGVNFIVRIPKEISDFLEITQENRKQKRMKFKITEKEGIIKQRIEIIDHEEKQNNKD